MADVRLDRVLERLAATLSGAEGDAALLARFVAGRDASAFAALLARHGPMVLGVCRRVLGNEADVEDAFQARFLVLARKAASVQPPGQVGNWLHGVALRTALEARRAAAVRRAKEARAMPRGASESETFALEELDGELARLPREQREVIVLCDLEGRGRREVAELLAVPEGTVASRLARARQTLARRLQRRGLASVVPGPAAVPAALARATLAVVGEAGAVPARVAELAQGVMRVMFSHRLTKAALLCLVALLAAGAGLASMAKTPPVHRAAKADRPKDAPAEKPDDKKKATDLEKMAGTWVGSNHSAVWVIKGKVLTEHRQAEHPGTPETIALRKWKQVRQIFLTGGKRWGDYELDDDTLKVWLVQGKSPKELKEFNKEHATLWVFKRYVAKEKVLLSREIADTFADNDALADEELVDKRVTVLATVARVRREGHGYRVECEPVAKQALVFDFDKDARVKLARLKRGQVVAIQGQCVGRRPRDGTEAIAFIGCKLVAGKE